MYLHQSSNLSNGITLSSNHSLNSLNMSDLHSDAFLSHPHLTTSHHLNNHSAAAAISTSPKSAPAHRHFDEQNAENYLEPHYDDYGHRKLASDEDPYELASASNLSGTESAAIIKHSLSCSPSISSASTTLNNITNFSNFISNSNLNKQLNQLADQTRSDGSIDCSRDNGKLFNSDQFDGDQNEFVSMDPLTRFLSLHPKYLELFDRFYNFLFNGDGPLRYPVRHYIAIMAAARHHCNYLVNDQQEQFKKVGGDVKWLESIKYAPKKIQNLSEINKILAHQPWTLTKDHIERLTKGEDNWSLSELVQAIVIMAQFHTLASFVFGCGFNDADLQWSTKANLTVGSNYNSNNISDLLLTRTHISSAPPSPPSPNSLNGLLIETNLNKASESGELVDSGVDTQLGNSMDTNSLDSSSLSSTKLASNPAAGSPAANSQSAGAKAGGKSANVANTLNSFYPTEQSQQANSLEILMRKMQNISEQKQSFESDNQEELVKNQSLEIHLTSTQTLTTESSFANHSPTGSSANVALTAGCTNTSPGLLPSLEDDQQDELGRFVFDTKFCYADFARQRARTDAVTTFKVQDYSWSDHAFSLVNRLYSDVGNMLDEKFTTIYNLTYWTMGRKTNVDTRLFRRAIWNYIQCMYGIRHDDYNYHQINLLLERQLKTYIKTVCCFPHQCRRKDCDTVMSEFRRSEKIHVNIMIAEARLQAELLYALRTISRYMT